MKTRPAILNRLYSTAALKDSSGSGFQTAFKWIIANSRGFLGMILLLIFITSSESVAQVFLAICSKYVIDSAVAGHLQAAAGYGAAFALLILLTLVLGVANSLLGIRVMEAMSNAIRQRVYDRLTRTEWLLLSSYHSGDLITRLTSDIGNVSNVMINVLPGMIALGVQFLAAFLALLHYDPRLAVLAFLLGPITVLFSRLWGPRLRNIHVKVQESESSYRSYIQETLENMLIVKTFGLEGHSGERLQELHQMRMKWILERNRLTVGASTTIGAGFSFSYLLSFAWGVYGLARHTITFGVMTAYLQLVRQIQIPFVGLSRTFPQIIGAWGSTNRIMELEALDREKSSEPIPPVKAVGIVLENVGYSYQNGQEVLNNVTASIKPGEIAALTGSSGEGKTTILRLLLALLNPDQGQVSFFDEAGRTYAASGATRQWVTYVPQGNTLFSGTIAENLRRGKQNASEQEMAAAVRASGAWEFISQLPDRFETVIGERGLGLSEGQAQRLAIARALLRRSPVMILDEATSALDINTEMQVLNSIRNLSHSCTCLIVTHRPSALNICSTVLNLEHGVLTRLSREDKWPELNSIKGRANANERYSVEFAAND